MVSFKITLLGFPIATIKKFSTFGDFPQNFWSSIIKSNIQCFPFPIDKMDSMGGVSWRLGWKPGTKWGRYHSHNHSLLQLRPHKQYKWNWNECGIRLWRNNHMKKHMKMSHGMKSWGKVSKTQLPQSFTALFSLIETSQAVKRSSD